MTICSERLDLVLLTPAIMRAMLDRNAPEAERLLACSLPADWADFDDTLRRRLAQLEADSSLQPWLLRAMVLRESKTMIGRIGFHDAPGAEYLKPFSPGAAEFGFTVLPEFRRRGFAREASLALMNWAREVHGVSRFVLSIRPDNLASQALAASLGFVRIGSQMDEIDGLEDVLELGD